MRTQATSRSGPVHGSRGVGGLEKGLFPDHTVEQLKALSGCDRSEPCEKPRLFTCSPHEAIIIVLTVPHVSAEAEPGQERRAGHTRQGTCSQSTEAERTRNRLTGENARHGRAPWTDYQGPGRGSRERVREGERWGPEPLTRRPTSPTVAQRSPDPDERRAKGERNL